MVELPEADNANGISLGPAVEMCWVEPAEMHRETDFALIAHWSIAGHEKIATCLARHIEAFMGWGFEGGRMPGPPECEYQGTEPSCCWKGCCAAHGKCHCVVQ